MTDPGIIPPNQSDERALPPVGEVCLVSVSFSFVLSCMEGRGGEGELICIEVSLACAPWSVTLV